MRTEQMIASSGFFGIEDHDGGGGGRAAMLVACGTLYTARLVRT